MASHLTTLCALARREPTLESLSVFTAVHYIVCGHTARCVRAPSGEELNWLPKVRNATLPIHEFITIGY